MRWTCQTLPPRSACLALVLCRSRSRWSTSSTGRHGPRIYQQTIENGLGRFRPGVGRALIRPCHVAVARVPGEAAVRTKAVGGVTVADWPPADAAVRRGPGWRVYDGRPREDQAARRWITQGIERFDGPAAPAA